MKAIHLAAQYFLNHRLRIDEVRQQVRELAEAGYECVYPHARAGLLTPYLSEHWFRAVETIIDEAGRRGMAVAIWDEDYYPSPDAGNRVVWEHPEWRARQLLFTTVRAPAGKPVELVFEPAATVLRCFAVADDGTVSDITAFTGSIKRNWGPRRYQASAYSISRKIEAPHRRTGLGERRFSLMWEAPPAGDCTIVAVQVAAAGDGGHNCDILNPDAIDAFLGYTHEAYRRRLGGDFAQRMVASFLDEPAPCGEFPWTGAFAATFRAMHGYDLLPQLAHLAIDIDARSPVIRHHYRLTQGHLQCSAYLARVAAWCHRHGILSIGHLTRTEWLSIAARRWPNELRCCRELDLPCTDPLGFHVALPDAAAYHTGVKVAASAARLFGKQQAGSDALAVMGNETALRDLAYQLDFQLALGVTYFNVHGLSYSLDGPRKDEVPPSLFYQHSEWPLMRELLQPLAAKCRRLAGGRPVRRLLVLYPSTTIACDSRAAVRESLLDHPVEPLTHDLSERLLAGHHDFDFIDEVTLAERAAADLRRDYDVILLHHLRWIEAATAAAVERFVGAGGRAVVCGEQPPLLLGTLEAPQRVWTRGREFLAPRVPDDLPRVELSGEGHGDVLIHAREDDAGRRFHFLFNRSNRPFSGTLEGRPVQVPPRGSCFSDDPPRPEPPPASARTRLDRWTLAFPANSLPLPCWKVQAGDAAPIECDLFARDQPAWTGSVAFETPFLLEGSPDRLRLVIEESLFGGAWQCWVNGHEVVDFKPDPVFDCRSASADIAPYLIVGSVPRQNRIRFVGEGGLQEVPFLHGDFAAWFRHGRRYLPNLRAASGPIALESLCGWHDLGYGSFSGCASYRTTFTADREGGCLLDCGRVEDAVECFIDGVRIGCRIQAPYRFACEVTAGRHEVELRVWNGPGNRERLSGLPAGLLGPVDLYWCP